MFTKQEETVFILGAGASWHYGYPTGEQLIADIIKISDSIVSDCDRAHPKPGSSQIENSYFQKRIDKGMQYADCLKELGKKCLDISTRLRQVNPVVIDYFLEQNQDIAEIGKLLIAYAILRCEADYGDRKTHGGNNNKNRDKLTEKINRQDYKDDWYRFLIYKLLGNLKNQNIANNQVSFVTFNYDISLERILFESLSTVPNIDAKAFLQNRFFHVYGKICEDFTQPPKFVKNANTLENIGIAEEAAQGIFTIGGEEKKKNEKIIEEAKEKIKEAVNVYVLGYGFDENNSDLLNLKLGLNRKNGTAKKIYFTNYEDRQIVNKKASLLIDGSHTRFLKDKDAYQDIPAYSPPFQKWIWEKSTLDVYGALERDFGLLN